MLHVLMKSPVMFDFRTLLRTIGHRDELLLLSDAVIIGVDGSSSFEKLMFLNIDITVYALEEDIIARGLSNCISKKIYLIDYTGFVKLTEKHRMCMSW